MIPYRVYDQINIGPITIYTWGFFVGLGFIVGLVYVLKEARKRGIDQRNILNLAVFIFIGAVLGARLGHILQFIGGAPHTISGVVRYILSGILKIYEGGMMLYGGFIGAVLLGIFYLIFFGRKKEILLTANILAPGIALGLAIGRIGCILINEHQGALTSLPWAILWPDGALRHPVAIYLSLNAFILFLILRHVKRNRFFIFLLWYSVSRFFLDFTRSRGTYLSDPRLLGLTTSQYISLTILIIIAIFLTYRKLKMSS